MTIAELITFLQQQDQTLEVAFQLHSEQCLLDVDMIAIETHCVARPDGWIQDARSDMPQQDYLMLPGN